MLGFLPFLLQYPELFPVVRQRGVEAAPYFVIHSQELGPYGCYEPDRVQIAPLESRLLPLHVFQLRLPPQLLDLRPNIPQRPEPVLHFPYLFRERSLLGLPAPVLNRRIVLPALILARAVARLQEAPEPPQLLHGLEAGGSQVG